MHWLTCLTLVSQGHPHRFHDGFSNYLEYSWEPYNHILDGRYTCKMHSCIDWHVRQVPCGSSSPLLLYLVEIILIMVKIPFHKPHLDGSDEMHWLTFHIHVHTMGVIHPLFRTLIYMYIWAYRFHICLIFWQCFFQSGDCKAHRPFVQ